MKERRKPWPRWAKILRNLLLAALLGFMMWDLWDQPAFSYMADLRRRERKALFPEPEAIVEIDTARGRKYRIEQAGDMAVTSYPIRGAFFTVANASMHPLEEGPNLICVSVPVERPDEAGQPMTCTAYAAVRPPEDAAGAVLTLHIDGGDYVVAGIREGAFFLFYACPEPDENGVVMGGNWHFLSEFTYELEFFNQDGSSISLISG